MKKDNIIAGLKKKSEKREDDDYDTLSSNNNYREIYVTQPSVALNQVYDELILYKQIYTKISEQSLHIKKSLVRYEQTINVKS